MTKISNQYSLTNILTADLANSRLGINNVSPAYSLDLTGTARVSGISTFSSNVGVGVVPQTWYSTVKAIQFSVGGALWGIGASNNIFSANEYLDATGTSKYIGADAASRYQQNAGNHVWSTAGSGTAGSNISFSERMRITSSGNVGIGTSSPSYKLHVVGGSEVGSRFIVSGTYAPIQFSGDGGTTIGGINAYSGNVVIGRGTSTGVQSDLTINSTGTIVLPSNQSTPSLNAFGLILQGYAVNNSWVSDNIYYSNGSGWLRSVTGTVAQIYFNGGKIETYTAGSDTAGSIVTRIAGPYLTNGGTSWTNSSDIRKKKNFEPTQGLTEILQIETIKYNLITEDDRATKRLGFKAQNLQTLIPEMVMETSEKAPDGSYYLGLTQDYILPVLVKAIQELSAKVSLLENK